MAKKITIDFEAGTAQFLNGTEKVGKSLDSVGEHAHKASGSMESLKKGFEIGAGVEAFKSILEGAKAGLEQVAKAMEDTTAIGRNAEQLGISVEQMSRLEHAANATHTEVGALTSGMDRLNVAIGKIASGDASAKGAADALEKLGLDAKELSNSSPDEVFQRVSAALGHVTSTFERAAIAREIFGRGGKELIPVMGRLNDLMRESDDIGFTRTAANVEACEKAERQLVVVTDTIKGLFMDLASSEWSDSVVAHIKEISDEWRGMFDQSRRKNSLDSDTESLNKLTDQILKLRADSEAAAPKGVEAQVEAEKALVAALKERETLNQRIRANQAATGSKVQVGDAEMRGMRRDLRANEDLLKVLQDQKGASDSGAAQREKDVEKASESIAKLKEEIAGFGKSSGEKKLLELQSTIDDLEKLRIAGKATAAQLADLDKVKRLLAEGQGYANQLQGMETAKRVAEEVKRLQREIDSKSGAGKPVDVPEGATKEQTEHLDRLHATLKAIEDQDKRVAEAKRLWEEAETPLQKYNDRVKELGELLANNALTQEQYSQAAAKAKTDLNKEKDKDVDKRAELTSREFDFRIHYDKGLGANVPEQQLDVQRAILHYVMDGGKKYYLSAKDYEKYSKMAGNPANIKSEYGPGPAAPTMSVDHAEALKDLLKKDPGARAIQDRWSKAKFGSQEEIAVWGQLQDRVARHQKEMNAAGPAGPAPSSRAVAAAPSPVPHPAPVAAPQALPSGDGSYKALEEQVRKLTDIANRQDQRADQWNTWFNQIYQTVTNPAAPLVLDITGAS
jgi:hypothetical protein